MTREEAKEMIKHILKVTPKEPPTECDNVEEWRYEDDEIRKALDMAIKALEQEPVYFPPCVDCNTKMNEIREAYDKLKPYKVKRAFKMGWDGKKERALMGGRCECGQYISDEDKYCRKCGRPLDWGAIFGEREGKNETN